MAIQLSPRSEQYLLNLAQIDLAGKKWDDATPLLERLKDSSNPQIAKTARKNLDDLPTLKKYGVLPQQNASQTDAAAAVSSVPEHEVKTRVPLKAKRLRRSRAGPAQSPIRQREADKGGLQSESGGDFNCPDKLPHLKLRTDNYKSLLLVGADEFSCDWTDRAVIANYKAGGKADGDLVSVEVQ